MSLTISDATERQRFEAHVDEVLAGVLEYAVDGRRIDLIHTEVLPAFEGHGVAAALSRFALDDARRRGRLVIASCPYVRRYLEKHRDDLDIVVGSERTDATTDATDRIATFRRLHESGCFVIPNPWDAGSAKFLAMLGFKALATTSSGFAWSLGKSDRAITLDEALGHFRAIAAAVDVPVNADFEGGFAVEPSGVGANVGLAVATGIAGVSIEDSTGDPAAPLFDLDLAVERIRAARGAIDASGTGVLLTGRSEGFIEGRPDLAETIRRLTAYAEAGADCLYAPGIRSTAEITAVVEAVAPKPVNVLVGSDFTTVAELAAAGVRRISVGGVLARVAWTGFIAAATEIAERGTFTGLAGVIPFDDLDGRFDGG